MRITVREFVGSAFEISEGASSSSGTSLDQFNSDVLVLIPRIKVDFSSLF